MDIEIRASGVSQKINLRKLISLKHNQWRMTWDLRNWETMMIELIIGGIVASVLFILQHRLGSNVNKVILQQEVINRKRRLRNLTVIKEMLENLQRNLNAAETVLTKIKTDMSNTDDMLTRDKLEVRAVSIIDRYRTTVESYFAPIRSFAEEIADITDPDLITRISIASRMALVTFESVGSTDAQIEVTKNLFPDSKQRVSDALAAVETELQQLKQTEQKTSTNDNTYILSRCLKIFFFIAGAIGGGVLLVQVDLTGLIDPLNADSWIVFQRAYLLVLVIATIIIGTFDYFELYIDPRFEAVKAILYGLDTGGGLIFAYQLSTWLIALF